MQLFALFCLLFVPNVDNLGDDSYAIRERETLRCDNIISAALLPPRNEDAEINHRVQFLRRKNLKEFDPLYVESVMYRDDFPRWCQVYLAIDKSQFDPYRTFVDIHRSHEKADAVFAMWPVPHQGSQGWLRNGIVEGEWEMWLEHRDYHLHRSPTPREKP